MKFFPLLWDRVLNKGLRWAIMYDYNNKSKEKQRLKSKIQAQLGVNIDSCNTFMSKCILSALMISSLSLVHKRTF